MVSKWWPMLGTFWGYCERVKQQTTEVNINLGVCVCVCMWTSASWLYLPWVWVWKCGILLVVTVHPEAQSYLRCLSTEIKIMMSIFPCFAPYLFFFCSMCLIFSGSIIYSDGAPQAKVERIKKDLCTLGGWMVFEICLALNEWVERMRGVLWHRCLQPKCASELEKKKI